MSHIAPPSREDQTGVLHGIDAIADYVGTSVTFTQHLLETETLKGTKFDDDWTAETTALEGYRAAIQNDRHRQIATVAFGPYGFPRNASFV